MFLQNTFQKCSHLQNSCYYKFPNIHKKISVLESLFNKVTGLMACNFIKRGPQNRCFPMKITKCSRKGFFMEHLPCLLLRMVEEFLKALLHETICMIRLIWTCKLRNRGNCICIKICMIPFLKDRMSYISSDLYEEILKPNKSHTSHVIQIVPCKTPLIQLEKDLCRRICKTSFSNWRHEITYSFLCKQWHLARLNLERAIFKPENETIHGMNDHLCPRTEKTLSLRKAKET